MKAGRKVGPGGARRGGGVVLSRDLRLTLGELCRATGLYAEAVITLVEHGVVEPEGFSQADWRFSGEALCRALTAIRLQEDLQVNVEGAALAVELLDEVRALRERVRALEALIGV